MSWDDAHPVCLGSVETKMLQYILRVLEKVKRATVQYKDLSSVLCGDLERPCVYIQLVHVVVRQKLTQCWKAIILQLKSK